MLTRRKHKWVKQRQVEVVKGEIINPSAAVESRYKADLDWLVSKMVEATEKELTKLFKSEAATEFFAQDDSIASQARILMNALLKQFTEMFDAQAQPTARKFARQADKASSAAVHSSLQALSGGMSLGTRTLDADTREILKAVIAENVGLIKSIPQKYLQAVQGAVMRSITSRNGMNDLIPFLQKRGDMTYRRARFIASDQTRKVNSALSTGRLQKLGVEKFQWVHTSSPHPRHLHEKLDGKVFRFNDPPVIQKSPEVRGLPAQLPGCRCRALPVFEFDK